jgi:acylphosphatase
LYRCKIKVSGKVQGVGYRNYTKRKAKQFNINGWVSNLSDGAVEIDAEGQKEELESFVTALKKGPIRSRVMEVRVDMIPTIKSYSSFTVKR